ncbi:MAG: SH3 domain-containing protein [Symbiopectobacterium sp.]|uniref:SH3 domain-containing protein n=1 Tax=Symbiopectobacterium sp. TaxID=2952789 RepID=UPI0039EB0544
MKKTQTPDKIKPFCLILPLLLSACHTAPSKPDVNDLISPGSATSNYIDPTKSLFSMENYSQSVDKWLPPGSDSAHVPVIDAATQQRYFSALKSHLFGLGPEDRSPWNPYYITSILSKEAENVRTTNFNRFLDKDRVSWGENFRAHSFHWKENVRNNAGTAIDDVYHSSGRNIVIRETLVRGLPTADPAYDDPRQAGQGYPFDNFQISSLRAGTPIYVLADSRDKRWKYVVSPTVIGWVHSEDIVKVDQKFVTKWVSLARKNLGAFIKEQISVHEHGQYYFTARPGTVLPFKNKQPGLFLVAVPVDNGDGNAKILWVRLKDDEFVAMPWELTPVNIATVMKSMSGRPYGWGNYNFYNDCSAELHSLLMPFGIFLPRNSADQIQATSRVVDLSKENVSVRISYLNAHGKAFTTLVYIPGHIMLYIGSAVINGQYIPMTYQNIWGLRPEGVKSRSIIGGSVFFPLLPTYPENIGLTSLVDKAQFKLGFIE